MLQNLEVSKKISLQNLIIIIYLLNVTDHPRFTSFLEAHKECSCCKGFVYACSDNSEICESLGICGCAYDEAPKQLSLSMDVDFYSEKEFCSCCKGLIYDCSNESEVCKKLGICGCCYDDSYFEEHKNCSCCKGFIYDCKAEICKNLGNCHCAVVIQEADPSQLSKSMEVMVENEKGKKNNEN